MSEDFTAQQYAANRAATAKGPAARRGAEAGPGAHLFFFWMRTDERGYLVGANPGGYH
jgi:hypothetical protein